LPNSKTSGGLLQWIKNQDSYTCVETLLTPSKKKYCLFMATPNFSIFDSTEGLGSKSEPLNMEGNPVVRPANGGDVVLNYDSPAQGKALMELTFRVNPPVCRIEVSLKGNVIECSEVSAGSDFIEKTIHLDFVKGLNKIEIRFLDQKGCIISNPFIQFRRIRITPPGDSSPMTDIVRKVEKNVEN